MPVRLLSTTLIIAIICLQIPFVHGQDQQGSSFSGIKLMIEKDGKFRPKKATVEFQKEQMVVSSKEVDNTVFLYKDIVMAEYSYSKSPRWKTGLGLAAAGIAFPPLRLIALPLSFTKHRRHWLTIRTKTRFVVLKLRKGNRKVFIPTFETRTGTTVVAMGEDK
jgi:hypothetical protein